MLKQQSTEKIAKLQEEKIKLKQQVIDKTAELQEENTKLREDKVMQYFTITVLGVIIGSYRP